MSAKSKLIIYIGILFFTFPKVTFAYLDPGTGSYIFQLLIAGLLGGMFFIKSIFKKIKEIYKGYFLKKNIKSDKK